MYARLWFSVAWTEQRPQYLFSDSLHRISAAICGVISRLTEYVVLDLRLIALWYYRQPNRSPFALGPTGNSIVRAIGEIADVPFPHSRSGTQTIVKRRICQESTTSGLRTFGFRRASGSPNIGHVLVLFHQAQLKFGLRHRAVDPNCSLHSFGVLCTRYACSTVYHYDRMSDDHDGTASMVSFPRTPNLRRTDPKVRPTAVLSYPPVNLARALPSCSALYEVQAQKDEPRWHFTPKLVAVHVVHGILVGVHVFALFAALRGWSIDLGLHNVVSLQTGITAGLQVALTIIVGILVSVAREIAVDAHIRRRRAYTRSPASPTPGLVRVVFFSLSRLALPSFAWYASPPFRRQAIGVGVEENYVISSGSIFVHTSTAHVDIWSSNVQWGSRFGDFDQLWPTRAISSSDTERFPLWHGRHSECGRKYVRGANQRYSPPWVARQARSTIFPPPLRSRGIHKASTRHTILNATLVNVHCSQISNATIRTFQLPRGSTDLKLAQPSPEEGQATFLFHNLSAAENNDPWVNVSMPTPPYWDPTVPGLNIIGYWGFSHSTGLRTKVFFQPWAFDLPESQPIGHHQLVMVIAAGKASAILRDSTNSMGNTFNLTLFQESHSGYEPQAYIQVVGCTVKHENLTATINPMSRLLNPLTDASMLIGPDAQHDDHAWDEFAWAGNEGVSQAERQFLLAFTPSSPASNDTPQTVSNPESILASLLALDAATGSMVVSPFDTAPLNARNALVNFQGALERLFSSYLWNINRLCNPSDQLQPFSLGQGCGEYDGYFSPWADFQVPIPAILIVVRWRAVVSLISCVFMWLLGFILLGTTAEDTRRARGGRRVQQANGLLDTAQMLSRGSRIPEVVVAEAMSVYSSATPNPESALTKTALTTRLRYVEQHDGLTGYLDIEDPDASGVEEGSVLYARSSTPKTRWKKRQIVDCHLASLLAVGLSLVHLQLKSKFARLSSENPSTSSAKRDRRNNAVENVQRARDSIARACELLFLTVAVLAPNTLGVGHQLLTSVGDFP
ncbi:hypothetical protein C8R44DRAFT_745314 [Mycena epipterygia]|nr:hypothetical protein C8R44DRAFT_745314 [Mycena epipterygia]